MDVSCLIAVDRFGASVLGRFSALLTENRREDVAARCPYLWAGAGDRPEASELWSEEVPVWTLPAGEEPFRTLYEAETGLEIIQDTKADGSVRAARVREWVTRVDGSGRTGLLWLLEDYVPTSFGRADVAINCVFVGALGVPASGALVLGFLSGLAALRMGGHLTFVTREYAVLGTGALVVDSSDFQSARARAARALLDLQTYFLQNAPNEQAAASYIIGEERAVAGGLDRKSQEAIAAAGLLAIVTHAGKPLLEDQLNPFGLQRAGMDAFFGRKGQPWDAARPFVALGAAFLQYPELTIRRILAARFASDLCRFFAKSDPDPESGDAMRTVPSDATEPFVERVSRQAAGTLGKKGISLPAGMSLWSWEGAREMVRQVVENHWAPLASMYGRERFVRLPLEDWEQALTELEEFLTIGVLARRQQDLDMLGVLALESLEAGLELAFRDVGRAPWKLPVDFRPRSVCASIVQAIRNSTAAARTQGTQEWLRTSHLDDAEIEYLGKKVGDAKEALGRALREVPSPIAVGARGIAAVCLGALSILLVPAHLGPLDPALFRALCGASLGVAGVGLLVRRAWTARRKLLEAFDRWAEAFGFWQDARATHVAFEAAQKILEKVAGYCEWLLDTADTAPSDYFVRPPRPWQEASGIGGGIGTAATRRRFLRWFARDMAAAADTWDALAGTLTARCRDSQVIRILPTPESDVTAMLGERNWRGAAGPERARICEWLDALNRWRTERTDSALNHRRWLPFTEDGLPQRWAGDAQLPSASELADEGRRRESAAFGFLCTTVEYLDNLDHGALPDRVAEYHQVSVAELPKVQHTQSDLFRHLNGGSEVAVLGIERGEAANVFFSPGSGDALAAQLGGDDAVIFSPNLLCLVRAEVGLNAGDVLFAGNPNAPVSHLGRAFKEVGAGLVPAVLDAAAEPPQAEPKD